MCPPRKGTTHHFTPHSPRTHSDAQHVRLVAVSLSQSLCIKRDSCQASSTRNRVHPCPPRLSTRRLQHVPRLSRSRSLSAYHTSLFPSPTCRLAHHSLASPAPATALVDTEAEETGFANAEAGDARVSVPSHTGVHTPLARECALHLAEHDHDPRKGESAGAMTCDVRYVSRKHRGVLDIAAPALRAIWVGKSIPRARGGSGAEHAMRPAFTVLARHEREVVVLASVDGDGGAMSGRDVRLPRSLHLDRHEDPSRRKARREGWAARPWYEEELARSSREDVLVARYDEEGGAQSGPRRGRGWECAQGKARARTSREKESEAGRSKREGARYFGGAEAAQSGHDVRCVAQVGIEALATTWARMGVERGSAKGSELARSIHHIRPSTRANAQRDVHPIGYDIDTESEDARDSLILRYGNAWLVLRYGEEGAGRRRWCVRIPPRLPSSETPRAVARPRYSWATMGSADVYRPDEPVPAPSPWAQGSS
ncbi:hypothetical protein B0H19DRAFT_1253986 [Mycena capillaripes]|nr:hypothetical protein B0H19DRAFT_1253986 [Mycena capillaripes]